MMLMIEMWAASLLKGEKRALTPADHYHTFRVSVLSFPGHGARTSVLRLGHIFASSVRVDRHAILIGKAKHSNQRMSLKQK